MLNNNDTIKFYEPKEEEAVVILIKNVFLNFLIEMISLVIYTVQDSWSPSVF